MAGAEGGIDGLFHGAGECHEKVQAKVCVPANVELLEIFGVPSGLKSVDGKILVLQVIKEIDSGEFRVGGRAGFFLLCDSSHFLRSRGPVSPANFRSHGGFLYINKYK